MRRLFLSPADAVANPQALAAVERADLIVMGPGSLFTSTLPPLLVPGLGRAVLKARGLRVYVCNLLQQPGETIGYNASHHVERLHQHVGAKVIDSVMVPRRALVTEKIPVDFDRRRLGELGVRVIAAQIVADDGYHHDPEALARALVRAAQRRVRGGRALL